MQFDFDQDVPRWNTDSLKWHRTNRGEILPMWVADMDFASPPCVLDALRQRVDHGIFGYALPPTEVNEAVIGWLHRRYDWQINPDWLVWLPGLVPGLHVMCLAFADSGQEILTLTPVYPPFLAAPPATGRTLATVPLAYDHNQWTLDVDALRARITAQTRVLLLCHPHNPVGRAYTRDELQEIAAVCVQHDLIVCADEIHCDLILDDRAHIPFATLAPDVAARTITLMSPAKTFNLPGLNCAFAVIPDSTLRRRFKQAAAGIVPHPNTFGYVGCRAAFTNGEPWRAALLDYLRGNRDLVEQFVAEKLPMFTLAHVEATYLAWIDTRALGPHAGAALFEASGVRLSDGKPFAGPGFVRLNFGCPRHILRAGLERMHTAVTAFDAK